MKLRRKKKHRHTWKLLLVPDRVAKKCGIYGCPACGKTKVVEL